LGTVRSSDNAINTGGNFRFDVPITIAADTRFQLGADGHYGFYRTDTGNNTAQLYALSSNANNSGAFALVNYFDVGATNRSPTTSHANPNFYIYASGSTGPNDFIRFEHNATRGNIVSGGNTGIDIFQNQGNLNFTKMNIGPAPGKISPYALKFINYGSDKNLELIAPPYRDFDNSCCRAQTFLLNLNNDIWNVNKLGKAGPYSPSVNGLLWGCAQVLTIKNNNSNSTDLLFKVEGQYDPNGGWYTKYYKNSSLNFDSLVPLKSLYFDTSKLDFIDPKIVDINFDGYSEIGQARKKRCFLSRRQYYHLSHLHSHKFEHFCTLIQGKIEFCISLESNFLLGQ
jgi:hypothetical protein